MIKAIALLAVAFSIGITAAPDAEAKRLGGARSSGMQRQQVTQPAQPPATQPGATAPAAGTAAAAAAPAAAKRSWAGPLAGLAAGLGLAALASYLGFGEALANVMLIALVAMAVLAVVGFILRKRAAATGPSPAYAGAGAPAGSRRMPGTRIGSALATLPSAGAAAALPAGFDAAAFARNAQAQFMALQEANDTRDLQRLRDYVTPDMFEVLRAEVEERGSEPQRTEVFGLAAQVVEVTEDSDSHIVSVRFTGSVREQPGAMPEDLDEIWHLTKPRQGAAGWVVAGIQQVAKG